MQTAPTPGGYHVRARTEEDERAGRRWTVLHGGKVFSDRDRARLYARRHARHRRDWAVDHRTQRHSLVRSWRHFRVTLDGEVLNPL